MRGTIYLVNLGLLSAHKSSETPAGFDALREHDCESGPPSGNWTCHLMLTAGIKWVLALM